MNFSVRDLPDKKDGTRLRIGLLSDWPTGGPASIHVLKELAKLKPDLVIHLGDTYYAGTIQEQRDFLHDPIRAYLGENVPIYLVPGNHDYYSAGGKGFYQILSEFNYQDASYFTLRGEHFQIIGVDTGILNNQQFDTLLPFLPDDQIAWANAQIAKGQKQGLKTIFMSHHQFFSRTEGIGVANAGFAEALTIPDRFVFRKYSTGKTFDKKAPSLPGALAEDARAGSQHAALRAVSCGGARLDQCVLLGTRALHCDLRSIRQYYARAARGQLGNCPHDRH